MVLRVLLVLTVNVAYIFLVVVSLKTDRSLGPVITAGAMVAILTFALISRRTQDKPGDS